MGVFPAVGASLGSLEGPVAWCFHWGPCATRRLEVTRFAALVADPVKGWALALPFCLGAVVPAEAAE